MIAQAKGADAAADDVRDDPEVLDRLCAALDAGRSVRVKLPHGGRVHIDRPLPFLVFHRRAFGRPVSAARGIATASPVYAVWPDETEADAFGRDLIARLGRTLKKRLGAFLAVELYDLPLPEPRKADAATPIPHLYEIGCSDHEAARAAAKRLADALGQVRLDRQEPTFLQPSAGRELAELDDTPRISLGVPRIYRMPGSSEIFPGLLHNLEVRVLDCLLQALCLVVDRSRMPTPAHYRALGRSGFIQATRTADRKLAKAASAFDFLLSLSPINTAQAWKSFREDRFRTAPVFHYRPLTIDPSEQKAALFSIRLRNVEDSVLEQLFREKQEEIDIQLTMLQARGSRRFQAASVMLYGGVEDRLHDQAEALIAALAAPGPDIEEDADPMIVDCHGVRAQAVALCDGYRDQAEFGARVEIRDDVSGLMVSGPRLMIGRDVRVRPERVDALLSHEVSVHLLTYFTGKAQGLQIFRSGLAGYEGVQEGLGVFAEYAAGGLSRDRLRLLAARVLATRALLQGADFMETFRLLNRDRGVSARSAFHVAARVHRSGGLTKDAIYLRGLLTVLDHLGAGRPLDPFWVGKIAVEHLPVVEELSERGFLRPPALRPEFLSRPAAKAKLKRARQGLTLADLI